MIPSRIWIWKCWFLRRWENRQENNLSEQSKKRTNNKSKSTYGVDGRWRPFRTIVLLQVDLTSFLASGASSLGREAVNRATKNRTKDFFESLYQKELGNYFRGAQRGRGNWPFPSSKNSHDEAKRKTFLGKIISICVGIKNLLSLAFKQRLGQLGNGPLDKTAPPSGYQGHAMGPF